jgi:PAS domain S-box-containing protein
MHTMQVKRFWPWLQVALVLALLAGAVWLPLRRADRELRADLLQQASLVAPAALLLLLGFVYVLLRRTHADACAQQTALQESEAKYRGLVETTGTGYLILDREGRVVDANQEYVRLSGHRELREILGRSVVEWTAEQARQENAAAVVQCVKDGYIRNFVSHYANADGLITPVEINATVEGEGESLRLVSLCRDVTDRKCAEAQVSTLLAESNQARQTLLEMLEDETRAKATLRRLAMAIEQVGEVVIITDPTGAIQYVNPAFETVTGYGREEVMGKNPRLLKSEQQDEASIRQCWATISAGRVWQGRFLNRKRDGTLYTGETTVSPVHDDAGQIVNYVGVERDITEQLRVSTQLQQALKMETVGRLAGGVAHDFNNLLMGIMNYVDLCRDGLPPDHPIRPYLDEITSDAKRSADITRQLLAFARKQTIAPKALDLNDALASMLKLLRHLIGENIDLAWLPGTGLWPVKLDPSQVDQVMANLCVNARDAIAGSGKITIATANVTLDAGYCAHHAGAVPGDYVRLTLSDDGCGMDKDVQAHLFEPFFTTKGVGEGTGLGLATVYGIIEQNRGHISVHSEPGQGTTFRLYLPRYAGPTLAPDGANVSAGHPGGHETILLAEDEKAIRVTTQHILGRLGYTVLTAERSEEALRLAAAHVGPIHLLITDLIMPGMNGRDLARRLVELRPGLKCLFMSGYTADVITDHGGLGEGMHFLPKPFTRDVLAHTVREVLG